MKLKLISCDSNYNSAGKKYEGNFFRFPRKIKKYDRARLYFFNEEIEEKEFLYLSTVHDYYFTDTEFTIETKNSTYKFEIICD